MRFSRYRRPEAPSLEEAWSHKHWDRRSRSARLDEALEHGTGSQMLNPVPVAAPSSYPAYARGNPTQCARYPFEGAGQPNF